MRLRRTALVATILLGLTSCHKVTTAWGSDGDDGRHGRYAGIGLFEPGKIWAHLQGDSSKDSSAAKPEDDDVLIVVVDSDTGEVRECGNYSGRCTSMSPWTKAVGPQLHTPVKVDAHAADLANAPDRITAHELDDVGNMKPAKSAAKKH